MIGVTCQAHSQTAPLIFCHPGIDNHIRLYRLTVRQGAGLVERQPLQLSALFKINAALDQYPPAGCCRQAADKGHWRGNDQRTGTGDNQHHQRLVYPRLPAFTCNQRRENGNCDGNSKHHRGINLRKAINKALRRGFCPLRFLHGMNDTRKRGISGSGRYPVLKATGSVDRPGEDRVAFPFIHRQAFAGNRCLINGGPSPNHRAVEGDTLARFYPDHAVKGYRPGLSFFPGAVRLLNRSRFRRQFHQRADGIAGAIKRLCFNQFRNREQHHYHGGFRPLSERQRPGDGNTHQGVDIQVAVAKCNPAFFVCGQATGRNGSQSKSRFQPFRHTRPVHGFGGDCRHTGQRQRPPGFFLFLRDHVSATAVREFRLKAQRTNGGQNGLERIRCVNHRQYALHKVKIQFLHG